MIGERIKEERERLGLTQPQFADAAGAAKRTLIEWEKSTTSPNAVQLSALHAIGVDTNYILTGVRSGAVNEHISTYIKSDFAEIPRYNVRAAAGHGAINGAEEQTQPLAFRRDWLSARHLSPANLKIIDVHGDSMEPYLKDKDLVLVDTSQTEINGGNAYVLRIDDALLVKKVQRVSHNLVQIASFNPVYPAYQVDLSDESRGITVIGRVVASMHEW